jgi:Zinc finger protein.
MDDHILIRPYFGRRSTEIRPASRQRQVFSVRNLVVHIDEMNKLTLDVSGIVRSLADALAFLLWEARVDGNGVEFVLAPRRSVEYHNSNYHSSRPLAAPYQKNMIEDYTLWMFNFNMCEKLSMDKKGVKHAVACLLRNDPYFPRPGKQHAEDRLLWCMFRDQFLGESERLLSRETQALQALPHYFVHFLVEEAEGEGSQLTQ